MFVRLSLLAASLALASCWSTPTTPIRPTEAIDARSDDPWLDGERCTEETPNDSALTFEELVVGSGRPFAQGDTVRAHYTASLPGGATLHESRGNGPPVEIILGSSKAICGFERALVGMRAGGERRAHVPWRLAFGQNGREPDIGPRADLVFVIDAFSPSVVPSGPNGGPVRPASGGGGRRR